jgi:predicted dehydrogenase
MPVPIRLAIIGGGSRGSTYASFAHHFPDRAKIVALAEPRLDRRQELALKYAIPAHLTVADWSDLPPLAGIADAVVIATPDQLHTAPALHFGSQGMHLLVEKPLAPTPEECHQIVKTVAQAGVLLAVGHVLRYTRYTRKLKELLAQGTIGELVSVQHLEPVGWWHQAHSFVRGNWRNTASSTFMLMAKSCHDLDWLRHIMDRPCEAVSSFGSLHHFRPENAPPGSSDRCLDCAHHIESNCPYSARKIYLERLAAGSTGWPLDVLALHPSPSNLLEALRTGPYGRCVYRCDNNVVDHQVVNLQFAGGPTASFTMTAFAAAAPRKTHLFGTHGHLYGDGRHLTIHDFSSDQITTVDTEAEIPSQNALTGHSGGDYGLMDAFLTAQETQDASHILSGPNATLESHRITFAAERARLEQRVVRLAEFSD